MSNTSGVLATGAYQNTNVGLFPIVQTSIPGVRQTGYTGGPMGLGVINIPPLAQFGCGPDSELIVNVTWGCNSSAGTKTVGATFGNQNSALFPWSDVQTTNVTNEWTFRISMQNNTAKQVVSATPFLGGSANALSAQTIDFTQPQFITIAGTINTATDYMQVLRYSVWLSNPPTYANTRVMYPQKMFWGGNAHFDDTTLGGGGWTPAQVVSSLQLLGMTTLRMTYEGNALSLSVMAQMAPLLKAAGIQMIACLDIALTDPNSQTWKSEAAAYAYAYGFGRLAAQTLQPLGVTVFECGNELDTKNGMNVVGDQGAYPTSFSNTQWPIFRGIISGCIAGVKSVPNTLTCSNAFTLCGVGASDMLWNGTAPDGSKGYTQVRWDITSWHNYEPYGYLTMISRSAGNPNMNLLEYISRQYQRPILISEFNGQVGNTQAQQLAYWSNQAQEYYTNRYKYNILGCMTYQLFQGFPDWGLVNTPGVLYTPFGTGVQAYIAANPDPGT